MQPAVLWFRRNLRSIDNDALLAAAESGRPVLPVYISDELDSGGASRWWLHGSLTALAAELEALGNELVVLRGNPVDLLPELIDASGAEVLYYANRWEPKAREQQDALERRLSDSVQIERFDDSLLVHPERVVTQSGSPYKVFTPFWRAAQALGEPPPPSARPERLPACAHDIASISIADLNLLPVAPDWSAGLRNEWTPGTDGALQRLDEFSAVASRYAQDRDRPDIHGTSKLSPHLHFGEISVRQVWQAMRGAGEQGASSAGAQAFLRQLYWREFSSYLLYHFPELPETPLRTEFRDFPWQQDDDALRAWQRGQTGFPIVDAGMRELWATGWMHNRVRMIVASFLVKDLLIPWQAGKAWFDDTLVDADLGNNSASWQWVAGCGTDSAPYFRIFNPVLQGKKFDPNGSYVRRWVPEIAALPNKYIHEPWVAPLATQREKQVLVGADYPPPIVDRSVTRQRALDAYDQIRGGAVSKSA